MFFALRGFKFQAALAIELGSNGQVLHRWMSFPLLYICSGYCPAVFSEAVPLFLCWIINGVLVGLFAAYVIYMFWPKSTLRD
jgi:hypothetical protein